jgi:multiple sugar transport system ATP-binding protein
MNILTVDVKEENGKLYADEGSFQIAVEGKHGDNLKPYVGKQVLFGVRPEDLVWVETPGKDNNIRGKVTVVEPLGAEIHLYVAIQDQQVIVRTPPRHIFQVDEDINLQPDMDRLHFFDMETENVIGEPVAAPVA